MQSSRERVTMLADLIKRNAVNHPRQAAFVEFVFFFFWSDVNCQLQQLANGFWKQGVRNGDRVGIVLPNSCAFVTTFLALARMGAVVVPVNPDGRASVICATINASGCKAVIFDARLLSVCRGLLNQGVIRYAWIEGKGREGIPGLDDLAASSLHYPGYPVLDEESSLIQMMTSGTTGQPKRVIRTHGQTMALARSYQDAIGGSPEDRFLAVIPLCHGHGFCSCLLSTLQSGGTLFLQRSFDRRRVMEILNRHRITIFSAVPFVFSVLADTRMANPMDLSAIRLSLTGAAPLRQETWLKVRDRLGLQLRQSYGSTETGAITLNMDPNPEATAESVGLPLPGIRVKIIDNDGKPLPSGTVGNIAVQSHGASELCHVDDRNALQLVNGWIRMNDLGRIDEGGRLYITGRTETIINVAGQKVLPSEVETVLLSHPTVKQVTVLPLRDAYGEEAVTAFVVACEQCTKTELLNHCRAQLADHKIPRFIEFRDSLPQPFEIQHQGTVK